MESDDDYESFSPPEEPSPVLQARSFKRLKKPGRAPENPPANSIDDLISLPKVDFAKLEALEASKTLEDSDDSEGSLSSSQGFDDDSELESGFEEKRSESRRALNFDEENVLDFRSEAPRSDGENEEIEGDLEFKSPADEFLGKKGEGSEGIGEGVEDLMTDKSGQKRNSNRDLNLNEDRSKSKKKKNKADNAADDLMPREPALNKRREQKERKQLLKQLHVETQRLLRETRDATFKPIPVVHKPISSVLQKIRQRKLEVSKKNMALNTSGTISRNNDVPREDVIVEKSEKKAEQKTVAHEDLKSDVNGPSVSEVDAKPENVPSQMVLDEVEVAKPMFRAPVDTQDLFGDSQASDGTNKIPNASSPLEEVMAPSILAMNLKFDSVPADECSSDEEDNHKENIDPHLQNAQEECPRKGDPVKAFVDEEAEEEDDSDNDLHRFNENEDEDIEDSEELKDIIATNYEERPMDNERRNELHRKWLEQQDADGTETLLKKLKFNSKHREATLLDDEQVDSECEEFNGDAEEEAHPKNPVRVNKRKAKQIITQMFIDNKDDAFSSDDEEETEKRLVKQHVLVRAEERTSLVSPIEDENSRKVFSLIKKLNVVPDQKKKAKPLSFFDNMVGGAKDNSSLKSSFLGRSSKHHLPVSHKQSSSVVRSFIFERDDSNSRNSISMPEDSSDTIMKEKHSTRNNAVARFSSSQAKSSTQSKSSGEETSSLFEILKRSSTPSCSGDQKHDIDFTQALHAAFKIPKKPFLEDLRLK